MVKKSTKKTQSKHVSKSPSKGYALPLHGFKDHYLTWQIGDISENGARTLGTIRFYYFCIFISHDDYSTLHDAELLRIFLDLK